MHDHYTCPACNTGHVMRVARTGLITRVPKARHYACRRCNARFVQYGDLWTIRANALLTSEAFLRRTKRGIAVLVLTVLGWVAVWVALS